MTEIKANRRQEENPKSGDLAKFISDRLNELSLSQREVADMVGFKNQNMITMIKQGTAKLALDRVPDMARAIKVDPKHLFRLALHQFYSAEAADSIAKLLTSGMSDNEREILKYVRQASGNSDPALSDRLRNAIDTAFVEKAGTLPEDVLQAE